MLMQMLAQCVFLTGLLLSQVFFRAEKEELREKAQDELDSAITGTHMLLWLLHFHDFCLTVGILGCGMKGHPLVLMSPLHFIAKPTRWMDFMARHRTSHTVGPDFAFGLLARLADCTYAIM